MFYQSASNLFTPQGVEHDWNHCDHGKNRLLRPQRRTFGEHLRTRHPHYMDINYPWAIFYSLKSYKPLKIGIGLPTLSVPSTRPTYLCLLNWYCQTLNMFPKDPFLFSEIIILISKFPLHSDIAFVSYGRFTVSYFLLHSLLKVHCRNWNVGINCQHFWMSTLICTLLKNI